MFTRVFLFITLATAAIGQQEQPGGKPPVKLNVLNVCAPPAEEQANIKAAMSKVATKPAFSGDFEVSRGRTTPQDSSPARFVRLRRDFAAESPLMTAQYSISTDDKDTVELLVLRVRDPKEFHELAFEDRVSAGAASPLSLLAVNTPATRIRLERLGKGSVVLARCAEANQSAYEPLFQQATEIMAQYRTALGLRSTLRSDLAWLAGIKPVAKSSAQHP